MKTLEDLCKLAFDAARLDYDESDSDFPAQRENFIKWINAGNRLFCRQYYKVYAQQTVTLIGGVFYTDDLDNEFMGIDRVKTVGGAVLTYEMLEDGTFKVDTADTQAVVFYNYYPGDMMSLTQLCPIEDDGLADALTFYAAFRYYSGKGDSKIGLAREAYGHFLGLCDIAQRATQQNRNSGGGKLKKKWDLIL